MVSRERALKQLKELDKKGGAMRLAAEKWGNEFQTLISITLSARTRDEVTIAICKRLFQKFPSAEELSNANLGEIEEMIKPINFFQNKSKNIIECSKKIRRDFGGKIPKNLGKLITLPGVGRKTANVFLSQYGQDAIGVDTHVTYISNYLEWANSQKPEMIERILMELFPKDRWSEINKTLVRFGKNHTSKKEKDLLLDEIKKI